MTKKILPAFFTFLLISGFATNSFAQEKEYFTDRLIIKYKSDQELQHIRSKQNIDPRADVEQMLYKMGAQHSRSLFPDRLRQQIRQRNLPSANDVLRIQEISFARDIDPVILAAKLNRMPGIEYAEPRYIRHMDVTPNDPQLEAFVDAHNFTDAWDLSQGSQDVIIATVDGGVGYTHPELDDNLWVNQAEIPSAVEPQADQNGDGTVTSTEIQDYLDQNGQDYDGDGTITLRDALHSNSPFMDGLDNDNNDFTDDLYGWDFWATGNAPSNITSDNDPFHDATDHGTHVAGISSAETNNGTGIASAGFNVTYMPIKAGGEASAPRAIGFGYEGILYAAENGADVINCSWSGAASSEAENDVINLATEMGALVVAAAGNDAGIVQYPAKYDKSLAVGAVEPDQTRANYSNFGYSLDVLATGTDILSATYNNDFISKSGTSMSTPVVSGLAALIKDVHPNWGAERIGMQIRASATNIDDSNVDQLNHLLGHGSIDAFRALNTNLPGLKTLSFSFENEDGQKLGLGEPGILDITITNVGNTTSSLEVELQSENESTVELGNSTQQLGSIAIGDTTNISFNLTIPRDFDLVEIPRFRLVFRDNNQDYTDFNVLVYENLFFEVMAANNVKTSFGAEGTIGFSDPIRNRGGVGFIPRVPDGSGGYAEGNNLLFEGGLMLEIDDRLYDAVRTIGGNVSRDLFPNKAVTTEPTSEGDGITGNTQFVTIEEDSALQGVIDLQTYAFEDPAISNVVFYRYTVKNPSTYYTMNDLYLGIFNDWDIGASGGNNNVSFSEPDSILYISQTAPTSQPVVAVAHMGPISGALAINNAISGQPDSLTFGLYDGFEDNTEKRPALVSGTAHTEVSNADVSSVVASGPYTLNPRANVTVGFIYAFGGDVDELRSQIAEARSRNLFEVSPAGRAVSDEVPNQTKLFQNYPNPFHEETQIHIDLAEPSDIKLTVYDVLGRKIQVLADEEFEAGSHFISFDAEALNLSSGIYFAHLVTDQGTKTIGMSFLKAF